MRCAVLGSPIGHSLSPVLHRAAYAELGLDWTYDAVEVDETGLARFVAGLDTSWRGLSLTMPLKRAVLPLLDELDPWAEVSRSANTVLLGDGRRHGHNTDVPGAVAALAERWPGPFTTAVVLGGGATAASVLLALSELGCETARLLVRDPERARETCAVVERRGHGPRMQVGRLSEPVGRADVLVSTIPASAQPVTLTRGLGEVGVVFEVLYHPWPTPLAEAATAEGRPLVRGLDLLVHQAALQVALMTDLVAPVEAMRTAGELALVRRAAS